MGQGWRGVESRLQLGRRGPPGGDMWVEQERPGVHTYEGTEAQGLLQQRVNGFPKCGQWGQRLQKMPEENAMRPPVGLQRVGVWRLPQAGSPQGCDHIGLLHKGPTRGCEPAMLHVPQWQALGTAILLSPGLSTLKSGKVQAKVRNWHPRTSVSEAELGSPGPPSECHCAPHLKLGAGPACLLRARNRKTELFFKSVSRFYSHLSQLWVLKKHGTSEL